MGRPGLFLLGFEQPFGAEQVQQAPGAVKSLIYLRTGVAGPEMPASTDTFHDSPLSLNPRSFSRNKRGIAGSLVWINFDRHALLNLVYKLGSQFIANVDDLRPEFQTDENAFLSQNAIYKGTLVRDSGQSAGTTIDQFDGAPISAVSGFKEVASPWYSDQILPFDITLAGTNEQGAASAMKITGVEILNEGSGVSIDDSVTEFQASFVARYVQPWQAVTSPNSSFFWLV